MRYLSIGFPASVEVVSGGEKVDAARFTNDDDAEFGIELHNVGDVIDPESSLYIETSVGNISGQHRVRGKGSSKGVMPGAFSEGFGIRYRYGHNVSAPGMLDMVGQSTKGVKEYSPIRFLNPLGSRIYPLFSNSEIVSYRGKLYLFAEVKSGIPKETHVKMYRSDNGEDFYHHYDFPKRPCPQGEDLPSSIDTKASISVTEHGGSLIVAYRQMIDDKVFIPVFKSEASDVLDWAEVSTIEVKDASVETDSFKLRIASGNDTVMIVFCSNASIKLGSLYPPPGIVNRPDFRYYISHDNGETFIDPEATFQKVTPDGKRNGGERITSLVPFFKDTDAAPREQASYRGQESISTGFDLYFDKDMGSFVILKASDSNQREDYQGRLGNNKLIGIKTVAGDVYSWEGCLDLRMDYRMNGVLTNYREDLYNYESTWADKPGNSGFDPFQNPIESSPEGRPRGYGSWLGYLVTDVKVIPGETENDIVLCVTQQTPYRPGVETGLVIGAFRFVGAGLLPPGEVDIGYGVASHEDYSFFSTVLDHRLSGILHRGVPSSVSEGTPGSDPYFRTSQPVTGVRHRGELLIQKAGDAEYSVKLGPYSNIGETKGYELSYPGGRGSVGAVGAELKGRAVQRSSHVEILTVGVPPATSGCLALEERQMNFPVTAYPYNSILRYISLTSEKFIKVKFKISLDSRVGLQDVNDFVFFDLLVSGDKQASMSDLQVRLSAEKRSGLSGRMVNILYGSNMTYAGSITDSDNNHVHIDFGNEVEFLVAHVPIVMTSSESSRLFIFYRQAGQQDWNLGFDGETPLVERTYPKPLADRFSHVRIGFIESLGSFSYNDTIKVGDFAVSSLGAGVRAVYTDVKNRNDRFEVEPFARVNLIKGELVSDKYLANPIQLFDRELPILAHSSARLIGGNVNVSKTSLFKLDSLDMRNPEGAVVDGMADSVYDFTDRWLEDPDFEIVLRNTSETDSDVLTLVNVNGVTGVTVTAGYWDTNEEWLNYESREYRVPMVEVSIVDVDGRTVLFSGADFEPGQVIGYSFFSYDEIGQTWSFCRVIVDNVGDVLKLDRPIPGMASGSSSKFFIAKNIMSFDISDILSLSGGQFAPINYGFKFDSSDDATFRAIGEISVGRWIDLSNHLIESSSKTKDNANVLSSDFGSIYPSLVKKGNVIDEIDLDFTYLRSDNGEASSVKDLIMSLRRTRKPFPLIEYHTDGQKVQYVAVSGNVEFAMEGLGERVKTSVTSQAWYPRPEYREQVVNHLFNVEIMHGDPVRPGDAVSFSISFIDPVATLGGNIVVWNLDSNVEVRNQSLSLSHFYTSSGGRVITVRIIRPDGYVLAFKRVSVFIEEAV